MCEVFNTRHETPNTKHQTPNTQHAHRSAFKPEIIDANQQTRTPSPETRTQNPKPHILSPKSGTRSRKFGIQILSSRLETQALCDYMLHVEHAPKRAAELAAAATSFVKFKVRFLCVAAQGYIYV